MDPYVAAVLGIVDKALDIWKLHLEAMTPEQRASIVTQMVEDMAQWRKLADNVIKQFKKES